MQVNITEFRSHLFEYINNLSHEPLELTLRGEVIARLLLPEDPQQEALSLLKKLRKTAKLTKEGSEDLGLNLLKPSDWDGDAHDHLGY